MNAEGSSNAPTQASLTTSDFSLVLGGPLYQLFVRAHLDDDALTHARRRVFVISLFCWLPMLLLSAAQGTAWTDAIPVPFLKDLELHIRFLVALPLFIIAELVVHQRMRMVVHTFRARGLIPDNELPRFEAAVASAFRLRNSIAVELGLLAFVYIVGVQILWRHFIALNAATWYATPQGDGTSLTIAGVWFGYVSLPIFQFLFCRWYFRIFIWARFLWQVSKIRLLLVPTHPDRLGGLGFLPGMAHAFQPLAAAHGAMLAGPIASRIFYAGAKLSEFRMEALLLVLGVQILVFGPLLVFAPQLAETRRKGMREYGTFAQRYVRAFDEKWLRGGASPDESPLGSGDIQSLADLGNSLEVVKGLSTFPVTRDAIVRLAATTFAPIVPLFLTTMPFEELLKKLFGMIF